MFGWLSRSQPKSRVVYNITVLLDKERQYWRKVLQRVVSIVKFLDERGLAFRGTVEMFGVSNNGNFLDTLELLAQYDSFLADHIAKYGNAGKGIPSYLSSTICDEFIDLMGRKVIQAIVDDVKISKYYSISIDSKPDTSRYDQFSFILRSVNSFEQPVERFLRFIVMTDHTGKSLADIVYRP